MSTTYEEACKCPKCGQSGEVRQKKPTRDRRNQPVEAHMVYCVKQLCPWFDTAWVVQVNADGSIPEAYSAMGPKAYPTISQESITRIEEGVKAQLAAETKPGAEIRGRFQ